MKKQIFVAAAFITSTLLTMQAVAQVATTDALKTKTKSNNTNEKAAQAAGTENVTALVKLQLPANGKEITAGEVKKPITFKWTPVIPKAKDGITYRLKVWQLMQGQNATQAMRTNKPIVTKDVMDITQAVVSGIYTGPCKPPYLCDFIWTVEAIAADGKPITENGTQEASSFSIEKSN